MKKIIKNKKADVFIALDFYAILILVIGVILLFLLVTFLKSKNKEDITESVQGVNFPHFFMNAFESQLTEVIYCVDDPNIFNTKKLTVKELLIFYINFHYNSQQEDTIIDPTCLNSLKSSVPKTLNNVVFNDYFAKKLGGLAFKILIEFPFDTSISPIELEGLEGCHNHKHVNSFIFHLPLNKGNIPININYCNSNMIKDD